jgi:hypothetical protein
MVHNVEKFKQEEGKKLKSNFIHQSFLNESFGSFVDFAYRQIEAIKPRHCSSNQQVSRLWKKSAARPGRNLFWGILLFNGKQQNVQILILLNSLVLYW